MSYVRTARVGGSPLLLSQATGVIAGAAGGTTKIVPPGGAGVSVPGVPAVMGGVMNFVRENPLLVLGGVALLAVLVSRKRK